MKGNAWREAAKLKEGRPKVNLSSSVIVEKVITGTLVKEVKEVKGPNTPAVTTQFSSQEEGGLVHTIN